MKEIATWIGYFVMVIAPFLIGMALYDFSDRFDTCESRVDLINARIDSIVQLVDIVSSRVDALEGSEDAGNK